MSHPDPDRLHTVHIRRHSADITCTLALALSREYRSPDEPLVAIDVQDFGSRSYATVTVRDETRPDAATVDLDLGDLGELIDALTDARRALNDATTHGRLADQVERQRAARKAAA